MGFWGWLWRWVFVWNKESIWTWTIGRYLYAINTTRKEREAALPPACPLIASWAQPTGKRIAHTET